MTDQNDVIRGEVDRNLMVMASCTHIKSIDTSAATPLYANK